MQKTDTPFGLVRCFEGRIFYLYEAFLDGGPEENKIAAEEKMIRVRRDFDYARLAVNRLGQCGIYVRGGKLVSEKMKSQ